MMYNESRGEEEILPLIGQGSDQSGQPQPIPPLPEDIEILDIDADFFVLRVGDRLGLLTSMARKTFDELPVKPISCTPSVRGDRIGNLTML